MPECEIHENLHRIHDEVHIFETAMKACAQKTEDGEAIEKRELTSLMEKMMDAMAPLLVDVPKYRVGLCYYSLMSAFCDLTGEDRAELDAGIEKAKKHAEKAGPC